MHSHSMQLHNYFCSHVFIIRGALIYVFLNEMLLLTTACSTSCDFLVYLWAFNYGRMRIDMHNRVNTIELFDY
jgi:hypothetical protein